MSLLIDATQDAPRVRDLSAPRPRPRRRDIVAVRPDPARFVAPTQFYAPDFFLRADSELSYTARLVGVALCSLARNGEIGFAPDNRELIAATGLGERTVDTSLTELENAGLIFRVTRTYDSQARDLERLADLGYCCPWLAEGLTLPMRIIVLLWRLPENPPPRPFIPPVPVKPPLPLGFRR
jgi:hypothetical protein